MIKEFKMKFIRTTILLALLLGISAGLFAGGFALSGIGSRAISMAGAFRGMADDGTAMYWNPAGLAFQTHNEISLGGTFIQPDTRWQNTLPLPGFPTTDIDAENKLRTFPSLFASFPKSDAIAWGVGAYIPYGLGSTWDAYDPYSITTFAGVPAGATVTWPTGFPEQEMSSSVAVVDLHPTVAYKLMDNLSFGVGMSMLYGQIDLAQVKPHSVFSYIAPATFDMSGTGLGIGANAGLMYKPFKNFSLGLTGKTPSNVYMEGEAEVLLWLNDYANFTVWGASNPAFLVPATYGGTEDITATLKLPAELGGGLSWNILKNWTVNLDYAYTMWERLDMVRVEMDAPIVILAGHPTSSASITSSDLVFDWKDTSRASIGTELRFGNSAIRLGAYYDETPIEEATQLPTLSDISDKMSGNIGFGHSFGKLTVDLNGQYIMFPERTVTTQTATNMPGVYNSSVIAGNLNLSYRF